jgi:hypothetical protein
LGAQLECHEGGFRADCAASFCAARTGPRPVFGDPPVEQEDPHFCDNLLFFHGDMGWVPQSGN